MKWYVVLIVFVAVIAYVLIGAAVFQELESDNEGEKKKNTLSDYRRFLNNKTCVSPEELEAFVRGILKAYDEGIIATEQTTSAENWSFINSIFFSWTVITTIGYGNISPSTFGGRSFCIAYALVGIPLLAVLLVGVGEKLSIPVNKLRETICCPRHQRFEKALKSFVICATGFVLLFLIPSIVFHRVEDWTLHESLYYSIITLTTIGFGDFVVAQEDKSYRGWYRILVAIWILIGLSWISVCIGQLTDAYTRLTDKVQQRVEKNHRNSSNKDAPNGTPLESAAYEGPLEFTKLYIA